MNKDNVAGWLQLAAGLSALFLQVWQALHVGGAIDAGHAAVASGLVAGGARDLVASRK